MSEAYWAAINSLEPSRREQLMDLAMGLPDPNLFKTPDIIVQKLHESIDNGEYNKYMPAEGTEEILRELVEFENSKLSGDTAPYELGRALMVPGGTAAFALITEVLTEYRDEVLVPNPSYSSLASMSGYRLTPRLVQADRGFNFSASAYYQAMEQGDVKLAWFCQPNNPTGLYVPPEELGEIIDMALKRGVWIVLDESCDIFRTTSPTYVMPENITAENVIRIRTFSKDLNLAGYRLGYIMAGQEAARRLGHVAPLYFGNPTVMANGAIATVLKIRNGKLACPEYEKVVQANFLALVERKALTLDLLRSDPNVVEFIDPEACYYLYARYRFEGGIWPFCQSLISRKLVNVVPGPLFGSPDTEAWVRICFARSPEFLREGLSRISALCAES